MAFTSQHVGSKQTKNSAQLKENPVEARKARQMMTNNQKDNMNVILFSICMTAIYILIALIGSMATLSLKDSMYGATNGTSPPFECQGLDVKARRW